MDLNAIEPSVILARGQYATVNGEYKTLMSTAQAITQQACDALRHGLQAQDHAVMRENLRDTAALVTKLEQITHDLEELKRQKDELWSEAWGKR